MWFVIFGLIWQQIRKTYYNCQNLSIMIRGFEYLSCPCGWYTEEEVIIYNYSNQLTFVNDSVFDLVVSFDLATTKDNPISNVIYYFCLIWQEIRKPYYSLIVETKAYRNVCLKIKIKIEGSTVLFKLPRGLVLFFKCAFIFLMIRVGIFR